MADTAWIEEHQNIVADVFRRIPPGAANGHDSGPVIDCVFLPDRREDDQRAKKEEDKGRANGKGSITTFKALSFVGFDELEVEVQKPWLLKNVIAKAETSSWIGGPGKGKSALLTDVAIHVAAGSEWRGYKATQAFAVVYLALERGDLVKRRLEAYKRKHGLKGLPIAVVTTPVNLMDPEAVAVLTDTLAAVKARFGVDVGLLIIDTFAKAIAYGNGDENSARDQNRVRGHLRDVQRNNSVHIALVGHTGKDETKGERGSNAGLGDVDVEVRITGDLIKSATVTKANDQPEGPLMSFTLEAFELGQDDDGEPITTAILSDSTPDIGQTPDKSRVARLTHAETVALNALRDASIEAERVPANSHIPDRARAVQKEHWRRYCYLGGISAADSTDDAKSKAFRRAVEGLQKKRLIGVWEPYVWEAASHG